MYTSLRVLFHNLPYDSCACCHIIVWRSCDQCMLLHYEVLYGLFLVQHWPCWTTTLRRYRLCTYITAGSSDIPPPVFVVYGQVQRWSVWSWRWGGGMGRRQRWKGPAEGIWSDVTAERCGGFCEELPSRSSPVRCKADLKSLFKSALLNLTCVHVRTRQESLLR